MIADTPAAATIGQALRDQRAELRTHRLARALNALEDHVRHHEASGTDAPLPLRLVVEDFRAQLSALRDNEREALS